MSQEGERAADRWQAFDRVPIAEIPTDDADALEVKLQTARRPFQTGTAGRSRTSASRPCAGSLLCSRTERITLPTRSRARVASRLATRASEVTRAVNGVLCAVDELRTFAGGEIPMGLTAASADRWAFTTREPIGVALAISAFNHPLNLIVHQVVPAVAVGCPVIVKPASATPLSCVISPS